MFEDADLSDTKEGGGGRILSKIHSVCQKPHMLQLIPWDDSANPLEDDPAVMVRP